MKLLGNLQADILYILYQEELTAHPLFVITCICLSSQFTFFTC